MRYSIECKDRIYVKGYKFLSFACKTLVNNQAVNMVKNFLTAQKSQQKMQ